MANTVVAKGGSYGHPSSAARHVAYMDEFYLNFGTGGLAAAGVAGSTWDVMNLPANTLVLAAGVEVIVADTAGNSGTLALADGAGTTTYVAAAVVNAAGQMTRAAVDGTVYGKLDSYPAPLGNAQAVSTLRLTQAVGAINAKVRVWAILVDTTTYQTNITG